MSKLKYVYVLILVAVVGAALGWLVYMKSSVKLDIQKWSDVERIVELNCKKRRFSNMTENEIVIFMDKLYRHTTIDVDDVDGGGASGLVVVGITSDEKGSCGAVIIDTFSEVREAIYESRFGKIKVLKYYVVNDISEDS